MFTELLKEGFLMVVLFSGVPLLASSVVGLVISVFQAATQIQEQSIGYLAKLLTLIAILVFVCNWFSFRLINFIQQSLGSLASLGRIG